MEQNDNEILIGLILLLGVLCIWFYAKLRKERKRSESISKENTKLIADNALLEAEQLKFQLQPHTLNNILANLKVIASKLNKGLYSLSETLEYILYKGNNHLVSVKDELNFIEEYLRLNELFISEIDSIKKDFSHINTSSKRYNHPCIPHLITAYFIENAFKHGDINHKDFLSISAKLTDNLFELKVSNVVKNIPAKGNGGLGLKNMRKRLELLSANNFEVAHAVSEGKYHSVLRIYFK